MEEESTDFQDATSVKKKTRTISSHTTEKEERKKKKTTEVEAGPTVQWGRVRQKHQRREQKKR